MQKRDVSCVECHRAVRSMGWAGCDCRMHKACLVGAIRDLLRDKSKLCPRCGEKPRFPQFYVSKALHKEMPLPFPMFYGAKGLVPYVSDEDCKQSEVNNYQITWLRIIDAYAEDAPAWVRPYLVTARKRWVSLRTTRSKWG